MTGTQYYMNIVVLLILTLPILILAFNLRIMVHGEAYTVQRLYVILLVPYVISSRILCLCLFSRLPNGMPVQLRGEQVRLRPDLRQSHRYIYYIRYKSLSI